MSTKKKSPKPPVRNLKVQTPAPPPEPASAQETPPQPVTSTPEPETPSASAISLETVQQELEALKAVVAELQETLARKRRPVVSNGKVQIRDKRTGTVYPSKNNAYQSLLKSGDLKELVDKGAFGDIPAKNTFGWYVLVRECPDRFEEVHEKTEEIQQ